MGWKTSMILINSDSEINKEELLTELGYPNLKTAEKETLEVACYPEVNRAYIGTYKGNTILCEQNLPLEFLTDSITEKEKIIEKYFPSSEICTLILQSTVNFWGYSITKDGEKIRAKGGEAEGGVFIDFGTPLKEEESLLSKSELTENGRVFHLEEFPDEPFTEDQVGEDFVFDLSKRYLGERLDMADDLLFEKEIEGYTFDDGMTRSEIYMSNKPKPWWKFW